MRLPIVSLLGALLSTSVFSTTPRTCGPEALASQSALDWGPVDLWEPMRLPNPFPPAPGQPLRAPTYLFTSYGKATYRFKLESDARERLVLQVEGPGGAVLATASGASDVALEVTVPASGTYRLHASSVALDRSRLGDLVLTTHCQGECGAKLLSVAEFFDRIPAEKRRLFFRAFKAHYKLEGVFDGAVLAQLEKHVALGKVPELGRFPTMPTMPHLPNASLFLGDHAAPRPRIRKLDTRLSDLVASTPAIPAEPFSFVPEIPELRYGHFADPSIPGRVVRDSTALAAAMTALAENNGSRIRVGTREAKTPRELLEALVANGHTIEVRTERTYANFLSLSYAGTEVQWPVWIDTGYALRTGRRLVVPVGHVQFTWRIWGPEVQARISFFHGMAGVGFFPTYDRRPYWTGTRAQRTERTSSVSDVKDVLRAAKRAGEFHQRIRAEALALAVARATPDGYGPRALGMCHDSVAALEGALGWEITPFPTSRLRSVDEASPVLDNYTGVLPKLPKDGEPFSYLNPSYRENLLRRVYWMTPYDLETGPFPDEQLRADLKVLKDELGL